MSDQTHTYECPRCTYNVMGPDADTIADAKFRHEDFHTLQAEFAARNSLTYACPLKCCDFTLNGTDIQAGIDEHETGHLEDADNLRIVKLAEANIAKPTTESCGGGVSSALDQVTTYGLFGETRSVEYDITVGKARGVDDDPGLHPAQIPALILELERLHGIWLRREDPEITQ